MPAVPLVTPTIREMSSPRHYLLPFEITGTVPCDDMGVMGRRMIDGFDAAPGKVHMLLIFDRFDASDASAGISWLSLRSRHLRSRSTEPSFKPAV